MAQDKNAQDIHFSPAGHQEVEMIIKAVDNTMKTTFEAFKHDNAAAAIRIEPLAEIIDKLKEVIKAHHVERLQSGDCGIEGGIALVDLVTSFERISSHCANISLHIVKRVGNDRNFDEMHGHANDSFSEEYKALYHYYESQYIAPVLEESALTDPAAEASKTDTDKTEKKSASKTNKPDNKKKAPKSEPSKKDGKNRPKKLSEKHKK